MPQQPNVLFLVCHDVGQQYGCYGNEQVKTPNIDRLAEAGMVFDNHYCQWPLCGPSRANLFTGFRPPTTRRFDNDPFMPHFRERMGLPAVNIPEHFRHHGYETGAAGFVFHDVDDPPSWSLGHYRPSAEEMFGERRATFTSDIPKNLLHRWQSPKSFDLVRERWAKLQEAGYTVEDLSEGHISRRARGPAVEAVEDMDDLAYYGGHVAKKTREMIQAMPKDAPWFYAAGFVDPHLPFMSPKKYWDLYDRSKLTLPPFRAAPLGTTDFAMGDCEAAQYYTTTGYEEPWLPSDEESLEMLHGRLAVLSYYDALIGGILDTLEETGQADNTIVVFISDHGFHDGEHGYWGKHNLWDKSLLCPLIVRLPEDQRKTGRVSGLTEHVDVNPTLCDLAGVPRMEVEGDSMAPLFDAPDQEFKKAVFGHRKHMWHDRVQAYDMANTARTKRYRYSEYLDKEGQVFYKELFDYELDPYETKNHAGHPEYAEAEAEMRRVLHEGWQAARP